MDNKRENFIKIVSILCALLIIMGNLFFIRPNKVEAITKIQELETEKIIVPIEVNLVDALGIDISILINNKYVSTAALVEPNSVLSDGLVASNQINDTVLVAVASANEINFEGVLFSLELTLIDTPKKNDELFKIIQIISNEETIYKTENLVLLSGVVNGGIYNHAVFPEYNEETALLNNQLFDRGSKIDEEGIYNLVITDRNGDSREVNFEIDKTPPIINILPYETEPTKGPLTVYAEVIGGIISNLSHTFTENGSFVFEAADIAGNIGTVEVTINNIYDANTIFFDTRGGTTIPPIIELFGSKITAPENPTRGGYIFKGWDNPIPETMPATDLTITALWEIKKYKVVFEDWDGSNLSQQEIEHGSSAIPPEEPTRVGYSFTGWSAGFTNIKNDLVITAQYKTEIQGQISISGNSRFGDNIIANTTTLFPITATITYQWSRNGTPIPGATNSTYTISQADIGRQITVRITGVGDYSGSITSGAINPTKANQTTTPTRPTVSSKTSDRIVINTVAGHEYRINNGPWQVSGTFSGLNPDTSYNFYARIAETSTHLPSQISQVFAVKTNAAQLESNRYFITRAKAFISKIKLGETIKNFISGILNNTSVKIFKGNTEVKDTEIVATGMKLRQYSGTKVTDELTIVVTGDITGNGRVGITDYARVKAYLLGKYELENEFAAAADVNGDGRISITDYIQIKAHLLEVKDLSVQEHK